MTKKELKKANMPNSVFIPKNHAVVESIRNE